MMRPGLLPNVHQPQTLMTSQGGGGGGQMPNAPGTRRALLPGGPGTILPMQGSINYSNMNQPSGLQDAAANGSNQGKLIIHNLRAGDVSESQIRDLFEPYGRVTTVSLLTDCILVRFLHQEDMERAVRNKDGAQFMGRTLQVEAVGGGSDQGYRGGGGGRGDRDRDRGSRERRRSPSPGRYEKRGGDSSSRSRRRSRSPMRRSGQGGFSSGSANRSLPYRRDSRDMSPYSRHPSVGGGPGADYHRREEHGGNSPSHGHDGPADRVVTSPPHLPPLDTQELTLVSQRPYDVAIVAMDQALLPFAESIEARLHSHAPLSTHIIMLREEAHVVPCVSDLTRKGVLFACIVGQQNEKHDSCTLRLLHGTPQEHRNMPMVDAMFLVQRQFDDLLRNMALAEQKLKAQRQTRNTAIDRPPGYVPPTERQTYLLNLLADGRMLTDRELQEVYMFLVTRIKAVGGEVPAHQAPSQPQIQQSSPQQYPQQQGQPPGGYMMETVRPAGGMVPYGHPQQHPASHSQGPSFMSPEANIRVQTAELQSKILSIINPQGSEGHSMGPSSHPTESVSGVSNVGATGGSSSSTPVVNFDDPKVREALNNLAPFLKTNHAPNQQMAQQSPRPPMAASASQIQAGQPQAHKLNYPQGPQARLPGPMTPNKSQNLRHGPPAMPTQVNMNQPNVDNSLEEDYGHYFTETGEQEIVEEGGEEAEGYAETGYEDYYEGNGGYPSFASAPMPQRMRMPGYRAPFGSYPSSAGGIPARGMAPRAPRMPSSRFGAQPTRPYGGHGY